MRAWGIKPLLTAIAIACFDWYIHTHQNCAICVYNNIRELKLSMFYEHIICHRHTFCGKLFRRDFYLLVGYFFISGNNKLGWIR